MFWRTTSTASLLVRLLRWMERPPSGSALLCVIRAERSAAANRSEWRETAHNRALLSRVGGRWWGVCPLLKWCHEERRFSHLSGETRSRNGAPSADWLTRCRAAPLVNWKLPPPSRARLTYCHAYIAHMLGWGRDKFLGSLERPLSWRMRTCGSIQEDMTHTKKINTHTKMTSDKKKWTSLIDFTRISIKICPPSVHSKSFRLFFTKYLHHNLLTTRKRKSFQFSFPNPPSTTNPSHLV